MQTSRRSQVSQTKLVQTFGSGKQVAGGAGRQRKSRRSSRWRGGRIGTMIALWEVFRGGGCRDPRYFSTILPESCLPPMKTTEEKSIPDQLTEGSEKPLDEKLPGGPFALVGLSYLVVLLIVAVVIILVLYSFR